MDFSEIQAYLEQQIKDGLPMAQLVVTRGYEIVYSRNFGWADAQKSEAMTDRHLCWCYSNTKVYTAVCLMRLAEEGKLSLDDPVSRYLPEFAETFYRKDDEVVKAETPITLRQLITMTSGLTYNWEKDYPHFAAAVSRPGVTTREAAGALGQEVLAFAPGAKFRYGLGHDVIGAVIEVASGMRFSDYVRKTILEPLGIRDTGFHPDAEQRARFAAMYDYHGETCSFTPRKPANEYEFSENYDSGGAGLFSRPKEYIKLLTVLACGGTTEDGYRLLKPETIDLLATNQLEGKAWETYHRKSGMKEGEKFRAGYGYGHGVRVHMDPGESGSKSSVGEFGWSGAAGAYSLVDREKRLAICYVEHILTDGKKPNSDEIRKPYTRGQNRKMVKNCVCEALEK